MTDSNHQLAYSGALIGSNDDLLIEILCWLPVISILRFKSVSKHWRSLLSHRRFTHLYNNVFNSPGFFIHNSYIPYDVENRTPPPFRSLNFYPDLRGIRIMQSCNGLLLCCSIRGKECDRKYYVFNPTTKQFVILPTIPGRHVVGRSIRFMGLIFHQTECVNFKVVCICHIKPDEELLQIKIYSSDTQRWKNTNESFYAEHYTVFNCGVYWNGGIHWAPSFSNLYFKLDVEKLQKMPFPTQLPVRNTSSGGGARPFYFGESRGHLYLVGTADRESHLHLNVYEMSSDHSDWFIKYQLNLDELPTAYPEMIFNFQHQSSLDFYLFEVLDVVTGEAEEDTFIVVKIPNKIIRYNIFDRNSKQIFDTSNIFHGKAGYQEVHRYIETLTSL